MRMLVYMLSLVCCGASVVAAPTVITGAVTSEAGKPIPGAEVWAPGPDRAEPVTTRSAQDGTFRLDAESDPQTGWEVLATAPGLATGAARGRPGGDGADRTEAWAGGVGLRAGPRCRGAATGRRRRPPVLRLRPITYPLPGAPGRAVHPRACGPSALSAVILGAVDVPSRERRVSWGGSPEPPRFRPFTLAALVSRPTRPRRPQESRLTRH